MGADNQAERVIARIEYRDHLCRMFWRIWRKHKDLAPPWDSVAEDTKKAVWAGLEAVLDEHIRRCEEETKKKISLGDGAAAE